MKPTQDPLPPPKGDIAVKSLPCWMPVTARELRFASRKPWNYYSRCVGAGIVILIVWGILEGVLVGVIPSTSAGLTIFTTLSCLLFAFVSLEGAWIAADSLSREKREGTLGLIFLTSLLPGEIVFSKLVACGVRPFFGVLAVIPVPSLSFFLGGLSWGDYARMMLALANGLFVSLAAGLLVSAFSRNERRAIAAALICVLGLNFIAPAMGIMLWSFAAVQKIAWVAFLATPLLACSPSSAMLSVLHLTNLVPAQIGPAPTYALSLAISNALGWCFVAIAARAVRSTLQENLVPLRSEEKPDSSHFRRSLKTMRVDRRPTAVRLAEWNVARCHVLFSGGFITVVAWGIGYNLFGPKCFHWLTLASSVLFLHWCLKFDLAIQVTRAISDEKRTGALEILLTTPLDPEEIVRGRLLALKRRFVTPLAILALVDFCVFVAIALGMGINGGSALIFSGFGLSAFIIYQLGEMYTLCWWGLWLGYLHDEPGSALRQAILSIVLGPFFLLMLFVALALLAFGSNWFKTPFFGAFLVVGWIISVWMTNLSFCARAISGLRDEFREIATGA